MRDYLFRAVAYYTNEPLYGYYWKNSIGSYLRTRTENNRIIIEENHRIIPESLQMYTGYNDKNGNMVFEGDTIQCESDTGVIKFGEYSTPGCFEKTNIGFYVDWGENKFLRPEFGFWANEKQFTNNCKPI